MTEDEESNKKFLGQDPRAQGVNVKVRTEFGSIHFTVRHDEQQRTTRIEWDTAASELHETSQIALLLRQCTDGINKAITAMNEDWSAKWNLRAIAERVNRQ